MPKTKNSKWLQYYAALLELIGINYSVFCILTSSIYHCQRFARTSWINIFSYIFIHLKNLWKNVDSWSSPFFHLHNPLPTKTITRKWRYFTLPTKWIECGSSPHLIFRVGVSFYLAIPNVGKCCVAVSFLGEMMQNFKLAKKKNKKIATNVCQIWWSYPIKKLSCIWTNFYF